MSKYILGISGGPRGSHEPSVACVDDQGNVIFNYEEERFNRYKSSISCFPTFALRAAFKDFSISPSDIKLVSHPGATYKDMHDRWPLYLKHNFGIDCHHRFFHHQLCHASSAYYSSTFTDSLVVTLDGIGDRASGCVALAKDHKIIPICFFDKNQSLGFFWAYICQLIGYDGLEDAYKTMGLAPYGEPRFDLSDLISYDNGEFNLNSQFLEDKFKFISKHPAEPVYTQKLPSFMNDIPLRLHSDPLSQEHMDIAASAQNWLETNLIRFFQHYKELTGASNLCFSGGVAMNSHFNGVLGSSGLFSSIYIPPFAGDSGLAMGSAQMAYARTKLSKPSPISMPYLGSRSPQEQELENLFQSIGLAYKRVTVQQIAELLRDLKVIGLYAGRAEAGPRALGNRSIIASPINPEMKDIVNSKIKYREKYRPFAPIVLSEHYDEYFEQTACNLDYMTAVVHAKTAAKQSCPAVVHTDNTSRVQIALKGVLIHNILECFYELTSVPVLLNTSFNLKGEPNVESPRDAIRTFYSSGLDHLVVWPYIISK
jgi:carbamoyltransferase